MIELIEKKDKLEKLSEISDNAQTMFGSDAWNYKQYRADCDNLYTAFLVLNKEQQACGLLHFSKIFEQIEILNIGVKKEFQRQGYAQNLINSLILNNSKEVNTIFLEVRISNQSAINLYGKIGFNEIARRTNYYSNPKEDAIIMELRLSEEETA